MAIFDKILRSGEGKKLKALQALVPDISALEPGLQADVIVLRTDRPNVFPINDPIGAVVMIPWAALCTSVAVDESSFVAVNGSQAPSEVL